MIKDNGVRSDALAYIQDIYPTICDLTGIELTPSFTGMSLFPVINNETELVLEYTYHAYRQHQRAFRKGDFKLIEYVRAPDSNNNDGEFISGSRVTQLFNIQNDPWETFNIAYFPEYKSLLKSMQDEMKKTANEL